MTRIYNEFSFPNLSQAKATRILSPSDSMRWPVARVGASLTAHPGTNALYLWGGRGGAAMAPLTMRGLTGVDSDEDVWKFDIAVERWEKLITNGNIPLGRSYHTAAADTERLWVHAGCPEKGVCMCM